MLMSVGGNCLLARIYDETIERPIRSAQFAREFRILRELVKPIKTVRRNLKRNVSAEKKTSKIADMFDIVARLF